MSYSPQEVLPGSRPSPSPRQDDPLAHPTAMYPGTSGVEMRPLIGPSPMASNSPRPPPLAVATSSAATPHASSSTAFADPSPPPSEFSPFFPTVPTPATATQFSYTPASASASVAAPGSTAHVPLLPQSLAHTQQRIAQPTASQFALFNSTGIPGSVTGGYGLSPLGSSTVRTGTGTGTGDGGGQGGYGGHGGYAPLASPSTNAYPPGAAALGAAPVASSQRPPEEVLYASSAARGGQQQQRRRQRRYVGRSRVGYCQDCVHYSDWFAGIVVIALLVGFFVCFGKLMSML